MKRDLVLIIQHLLCRLKRIDHSTALSCFFQAVILLFTLSCNNTSIKNVRVGGTKRINVYLSDSLGLVSFNDPIRYDTTFSWIHYSDCNSCHEQKFRFQSKKDPIIKETGYMWTIPKDSVDRFTISYKKYLFSLERSDTLKDLVNHYHFKEKLKNEKIGMQIVNDTIYKINDRYFSIYELKNTDSIHRKEVLATTTINGNELIFSCELMTGNTDSVNLNFFRNSVNLINSIVIKNGR